MSRRNACSESGKSGERFEIGGQWLGQEQEGGNFYRYWYQPGKPGKRRNICRRSLGTKSLEEAKRKLAEFIVGSPPDEATAPDNVFLVTVKKFYMDNHGNETVSVAAANRAWDLVFHYLKEERELSAPMVSDFSLPWQHAFFKWARQTHELSAKSISNYMITIKASIAMAAKPIVAQDARGVQKEVTILSQPVYIESSERFIAKFLKAPRSRPRASIPDLQELAAFFDAIQEEHTFRYCIIALNTWARTEAICQLDFGRQVDFKRNLIDMNPEGRPQNNKIRPMIPLTENLRSWALFWNQDRPINYQGEPVASVDARTLKKIAERAGIGKVTPYTLRHFIGSNIRSMPGIDVSREQRAEWMGHVDPDNRTTEEWYETFDPDYLEAPRRATDAIMQKLHSLAKRSLFAPNMSPNQGLTIVSKPMILVGKKNA
jgi:integrase